MENKEKGVNSKKLNCRIDILQLEGSIQTDKNKIIELEKIIIDKIELLNKLKIDKMILEYGFDYKDLKMKDLYKLNSNKIEFIIYSLFGDVLSTEDLKYYLNNGTEENFPDQIIITREMALIQYIKDHKSYSNIICRICKRLHKESLCQRTKTCIYCNKPGHYDHECYRSKLKCKICQKNGHNKNNCPTISKCKNCNQYGHILKDCKIPKLK